MNLKDVNNIYKYTDILCAHTYILYIKMYRARYVNKVSSTSVPCITCFTLGVTIEGKGKKFTLEQAMKAQRGSRGIALLFL